jgi:hypothetical protein
MARPPALAPDERDQAEDEEHETDRDVEEE